MSISSNRLRLSAARRPRNTRLRLESCEERAVPASVVNATLAAGTLTLTAVDAASVERLILTPGGTPGLINVAAGDLATTISLKGAAPQANVDIPGVKALSINLKGSVDSVDLQGIFLAGNVTIKGTGSDKNWSLSAGTIIGGSVTLSSGDGDDVVTVDGTRIGKGLTVSLGKTNVNNQLTIENGSYIGQSVTVTGSAGQENVNIEGSTIGGSLTTTLMAGADAVNLKTVSIGGNLTATLAQGPRLQGVQPEVDLTYSTVGGNVKVTTGNSDDLIKLNDATVGGKSTINLGNGLNTFAVDGPNNDASLVGSFLLGGVSVTGGTSVDTIKFGSDKPVLVGGAVSMMLGSETAGPGDSVTIDDTTFLDAVKIDFGSGKGADTLSIETLAGTATKLTSFYDKFTVTMGQDNDTVVLGTNGVQDQQVMFGVAPSIDGGKSSMDNDSITRGNGQIDSLPFTNNTSFFKNFETIV